MIEQEGDKYLEWDEVEDLLPEIFHAPTSTKTTPTERANESNPQVNTAKQQHNININILMKDNTI